MLGYMHRPRPGCRDVFEAGTVWRAFVSRLREQQSPPHPPSAPSPPLAGEKGSNNKPAFAPSPRAREKEATARCPRPPRAGGEKGATSPPSLLLAARAGSKGKQQPGCPPVLHAQAGEKGRNKPGSAPLSPASGGEGERQARLCSLSPASGEKGSNKPAFAPSPRAGGEKGLGNHRPIRPAQARVIHAPYARIRHQAPSRGPVPTCRARPGSRLRNRNPRCAVSSPSSCWPA